jgi:glycosyltransferase involved in cell wall biosynthesis
VVHFDTLGLAQYRPFVGDCGAVLNHHDLESAMMARRASTELNVLRRHYWQGEARKLRDAEQKWCPKFEANLVVSSEEEALLTTALPGLRTIVVPNGVDTTYFKPRPDRGGRTLLFCGSLDWYPNSDAMKFFFDAIWPRLTSRLPHVRVYVVGRHPPHWLQHLSAIDPRIQVPGFVDDVRPYFNDASLYVCPITEGGGTRLKILDALAMGVPLVATSFACSGLGLQDRRHALLAETPDDFVNQIQVLLSDTALRVRLAAAGRELVERLYSWGVIGQSLLEAYRTAWQSRTLAKAGVS